MQRGTAEAAGALGRGLKGPQKNRSADCGEGPHVAYVGGWESGGGPSKGYLGEGEGVCCDQG